MTRLVSRDTIEFEDVQPGHVIETPSGRHWTVLSITVGDVVELVVEETTVPADRVITGRIGEESSPLTLDY